MKICAFVALFALVVVPVSAAEVDSVAKDIIGAWRLEFTTPDDVQRSPTVIVGRQRDELVAWYVENGEPEEFKNVRLENDALRLTIVPKERNGDATVTFEAKLKQDDVCHGKAEYALTNGDSGTWDFTGKRITPSDFDNVTQWDLSFVTPDDQERKATITVLSKGDNVYAWYSSEDYELPAKRMSLSGDDVLMSITVMAPNGSNVDVTFQGAIDGDRVSGDAKYSFEGDSGTFPFKGQRKS